MPAKATKILSGLTWKHDRGLGPLLATARRFSEEHPEVRIEWQTRSLQDFGEASIQSLADRYDLVIIDHPFIGAVAREKCFLALDEHLSPEQQQELGRDSVGQSYLSYWFAGHLWSLPIDAAAQVAGYRADLLQDQGFKVPQTWKEVMELAKFRRGFVSAALFPLDSLMCFFTFCANLGDPAFSRHEEMVSEDIGLQALDRLRVLAEHSVDDALSLNPIAIWERMSSSDEIAYCPLAFGYSNYARKGYRPKLLSFGPIPSAGRGPVGATLGGTGLAISESCRHRDLALDYAWWVAGQECQRTIYVESGGQPSSKTAWLDPHANELTTGYFAATLPVLESAWLRPRFAGFEAFQVEALTAVGEFLRRKTHAEKTLSRLGQLYRNALANAVGVIR
jgi:multiple sugar transport system substrate-binding protein